ncbi:Uma2 family endonuclease [Nocardia sp. NPDC003693]
MPIPRTHPELSEYMTWEELARLPKEIAGEIELWEGRVVWLPREPPEHQTFTSLFFTGMDRCLREFMPVGSTRLRRAAIESTVFLGESGRSDFLTPDFLVHRRLEAPYQDIRAADVFLVGEVLSPFGSRSTVESKKYRYASAGIPWYWEVQLATEASAVARVRAFGLQTAPAVLPEGVRPLHTSNYILAAEWFPADTDGIDFDFPFPIHIPWSELEY